MDYFEDLLKKPTIFIDESKLEINYIPPKLPHREKELLLLSRLFLALFTNPNSISRRILITGKTGIGKSATVKLFGEMIEKVGQKRNVHIKYIHINCRKERTSYKVLINIVRLIDNNFPKRGFSPQDLLDFLIENLNTQNLHLLIVLDELSYLIKKEENLIYSLTRINDDSVNKQQKLSIIGIVRDISCLNNLDYSTLSTLQRNIIKFSQYTKEQIFDILKYRADLSLNKNIISDNLIEMITTIVFKNGDIRQGLSILWRAAKIAESQNLKYINAECIRLGNQDLVPISTLDTLEYLSSQKLILLFAISKCLRDRDKKEISFSEVLKFYKIVCENTGLAQRSYSQLWNYIQELNKENLISINVKSEKIRGRKAFVEIPNIVLSKLEKLLIKILNSKGLKI